MKQATLQFDPPPGGPIVMLGRGHSGTRLLAEMFRRSGVYLGGNLNPMFDATTWLPTVEKVILGIYPRYHLLETDDQWHRLIQETTTRFLAEGYRSGPWGWKLCESTFVMPLLARVFPNINAFDKTEPHPHPPTSPSLGQTQIHSLGNTYRSRSVTRNRPFLNQATKCFRRINSQCSTTCMLPVLPFVSE